MARMRAWPSSRAAVAAANATLIRAHQVVGEIDVMASQFAQSPIGSIVGESGGALPFLTACCRVCMCVSQRVPLPFLRVDCWVCMWVGRRVKCPS